MHVDAAIKWRQRPAKHVFRQPVAGQHFARMTQEHFQQHELGHRQIESPAGTPRLPRCCVKPHISDVNSRNGSTGASAPQDCPHPRHQFARVERLRQIIVGAELQTENPIHILSTRRENQHGRVRSGAQFAQDVEPAHAGQQKIENHERMLAGARAFEAAHAVMHGFHLEPFCGEIFDENFAQLHIIVDEKNVFPTWTHHLRS